MDYLVEFKKEFKKLKVRQTFKENIEPEEILLDAQKPEFNQQKIELPLKPRVFFAFFAIILTALVILASRSAYLQIWQNKNYAALAQSNSLRAYPILAPRGLIYDRNLKTLVTNAPSFNILLTPQDLPKDKQERETVIEQISFLLGLNPKDVNQELANFDFEKSQNILLAVSLAPDEILPIESRIKDFPELTLEEGIIRQYPLGESLSHVLGYTGKINKDELSLYGNYYLSERIGKEGLESSFEQILRGTPGERQVEVNALGRQIQEIGIKPPISGQNIVTTIDSDLQKEIFDVMSRTAKNSQLKRGAAVALDPRDGQVLAMVSLPSYDDNIFEQGILPQDLEKIQQDPDKPLFNRAISGQYPSGSTIKPVIGAAALQEKVISPQTTIYDSGSLQIVNQYNSSISL